MKKLFFILAAASLFACTKQNQDVEQSAPLTKTQQMEILQKNITSSGKQFVFDLTIFEARNLGIEEELYNQVKNHITKTNTEIAQHIAEGHKVYVNSGKSNIETKANGMPDFYNMAYYRESYSSPISAYSSDIRHITLRVLASYYGTPCSWSVKIVDNRPGGSTAFVYSSGGNIQELTMENESSALPDYMNWSFIITFEVPTFFDTIDKLIVQYRSY